MYFDKLCTISCVKYTKVWGTSKRIYSCIYDEKVPCNYEQSKRSFGSREYAENTDTPWYTVVLPIEYNKVRENHVIELEDPIMWCIGTYIVSSVDAYPSLSGSIDCITLSCDIMKWQQ